MSGKKKVERKVFHQGKNFKSDNPRTPIKGTPNTNLDFYEKESGRFVRRRKFDDKGNAKKDLDKAHSPHNDTDYGHDYFNAQRNVSRPLTKKEKREIKKASKKRRVLK